MTLHTDRQWPDDALLPCPFCGEVPKQRCDDGITRCLNSACGVNVEAFSVEDWNTRNSSPLAKCLEALEEVWDWMGEVWDKPEQPPLELYKLLEPLLTQIGKVQSND